MKKIEKSIELGGRTLTLSTGELANQADGAVLASYGETVVLATVVGQPLRADLGYFPLSVDYQEKLYAGGRIKGSRWVKREGRPTDEEILSGRLIDRSIRPLFPKSYKNVDVQVILTVLSLDLESQPEIVAAIAVSAALAISRIPWQGPVGVIKVGLRNGKFITNPKESELKESELDLIVSSTKKAIMMLEAAATEASENEILGAIEHAQKEASKVIDLINDLVTEVKPKKDKVEEVKPSRELQKKVEDLVSDRVEKAIPLMASKEVGYSEFDQIKQALTQEFGEEEKILALDYFEDFFKEKVRSFILSGKRPDSRAHDEIRELSSRVGVLPRTHGSAIFQRGQTQALTTVTLGAQSLEQLIETAAGEETKRYIHHYSMPPFSTGETGKVGFPNRREIGHGALAERALIPVIPSEDEFPYTIRVVTEILSSNGSTSMASVCGSSLSLMDAGVPIKSPIAGIAMGLVIESDKKFAILTDIVGLEDMNGDMDFKVAGSSAGITALQLDVKTEKLTLPILEKALAQSKEARMKILKKIESTIDKPRLSVSKYAPKIKVIKIDKEKIGELIGPGGKTIRKIIAETGAQIDVDDDGTVHVSGITEEDLKAGLDRIETITKEPKPGEIYQGVVKRIQPFGAFVEILPGKEGMVHVSDMREDFVKDPADIVKVGDKVEVRVKEIDELGRLNLSMMLDPSFDQKKEQRKNSYKSGGKYFEKTPRTDRKSGGPHFPTSRLLHTNAKRYGR